MQELLTGLMQILEGGASVIVALVSLLLPWIPLFAWVGFWTFAVNWSKLRLVLVQGGWIGLLLIALVSVLIWGTVAPPQGGTHNLLGLTLSNFVGKTVYVTALTCIVLLCGSLQLSGFCAGWCQFDEPEREPVHSHGGHGHDDHGHHAPAHGDAHHAGHH